MIDIKLIINWENRTKTIYKDNKVKTISEAKKVICDYLDDVGDVK